MADDSVGGEISQLTIALTTLACEYSVCFELNEVDQGKLSILLLHNHEND
jgi:hypothetical protein